MAQTAAHQSPSEEGLCFAAPCRLLALTVAMQPEQGQTRRGHQHHAAGFWGRAGRLALLAALQYRAGTTANDHGARCATLVGRHAQPLRPPRLPLK